MNNPPFLQCPAGYQPGPHVAVALPPRLPPVGVILRHYVQHVTLLEVEAGLFARDVRVAGGRVVEVRADTHFALAYARFAVGRDEFESYRAFGVLLERVLYKDIFCFVQFSLC